MRRSRAHSGRQRQVDDQQQGVADEEAGQQRPHQVGLVGHQCRAGLDAIGLQRGDQHGGGRGDRETERQQGHEHARGARVVGRLGAGDAFDRALTELAVGLPATGQLALGDVGQEGRRLRAAGRHRAEREAQRRATQPGSPGAPPVVAAHERLPGGDHVDRLAPQMGSRPHRLAHGEDPDRDDHDVDAVRELEHATGEPRLAGGEVQPDQPDRQPHEQADEAADLGGSQHAGDQHQRQQHDREVRRRADLHGLLRDGRA